MSGKTKAFCYGTPTGVIAQMCVCPSRLALESPVNLKGVTTLISHEVKATTAPFEVWWTGFQQSAGLTQPANLHAG